MSVSVYIENESTIDDYNVANGNWFRMNELLGSNLDTYGEMHGQKLLAFRNQVVFALDSIKAMPQLDGGKIDVRLATNVIECGLPEGYWAQRLTQLLDLIDRALTEGKTLCWS